MSAAAPAPKANMGVPAPRIDGRLKVTGEARYAADFPAANLAYGALVTSTIAKGTVIRVDFDAARAVPGVLDIVSYGDMEGVKKPQFGMVANTSVGPLHEKKIWHDGQIVALVVGETEEAAAEGAAAVRVTYQAERPSFGFDAPGAETVPGVGNLEMHKEDPKVGDFEGAFAAAPVKLDARYSTPTQHHNPIELFSTTCEWHDDHLTVYEPSQNVNGFRHAVATQLQIDPEKVQVIAPYVGGGFGSKGSMTPRTAIVAVAARRLNRPVRCVETREQGFTIQTFRAETRHHVRIGAEANGKITAFAHEGWELTSRSDNYGVAGTKTTARLYDYGAVLSKVSLVKADRNTPGFMRSPPEVPYMYALECALDELAVELNMDPVELRRINDTMKDPVKGAPFTSRSLMRCFDEAASAFGWKNRTHEAGIMRDGDWLVGYGCASAVYPTNVAPAAVRVRLYNDGHVLVQTSSQEIGTGVRTVSAQMAAERLGVDISAVTVEAGDTDLPPAPVAGGSNSTASICSAVLTACDRIRARRDARANEEVIEEYVEWSPNGPEGIQKLYKGEMSMKSGSGPDKMMYAFGAEFVEVRVNRFTREIRCPRAVGAFAGGHIMNTRTARSQLMGGMIWGIGSALHEATEIDKRTARYVNRDLAEYLVPVNADVAQVDVILVSEEDHEVNPAGVKGLGELGNVGTAAAIANAVYHATGKRIRDLPIRIDNLIA